MSLDVYLRGKRIGTLFPVEEGDYRLAYAPEVVEEVGAGTTLLSSALPARAEPFSAASTRAYIEGLLPEGPRREGLARELGVAGGDSYALLAELGRDCAGAVVFLPEGSPPPSEAEPPRWLEEAELEELIGSQPPSQLTNPAASERRVRATLAGRQPKLALVHEEASGRWGWPGPGRPSTHVVKPETGEHPGHVPTEMYCMTVARCAGLPVAHTEVETIAGRRCLVSRRFDRAGEGADATRIHQEDFCQALGFPPGGEEGPGFAEAAGLLRAVGRTEDVPVLVAAALCGYALGNGDATGKNFALLHEEGGTRLAPLYDLTSTVIYGNPIHTGLVVSEQYGQSAYMFELGWIGEECGIDLHVLRKLTSELAARITVSVEEVVERGQAEGWRALVTDEIAELARERAEGLGFEVEY